MVIIPKGVKEFTLLVQRSIKIGGRCDGSGFSSGCLKLLRNEGEK